MKRTVFSGALLLVLNLNALPTAHAQRAAAAVPTVVNGFVVAITVTDPGQGYTTIPAVTITGGGGTGATATATVRNGVVDKVSVVHAGSGYAGAPVVTIESPGMAFADGLVAYYPFDGDAHDASGNANHGTLIGTTPAPDRFGNSRSSRQFNGVTDYINVPSSPSLKFGHQLTVSAWVFPDLLRPSQAAGGMPIHVVVKGYDGPDIMDWGFSINGDQERPMLSVNGWTYWDSASIVRARVWQHVVFTFDGLSMRTYLNAQQSGQHAVSGSFRVGDGPVRIGAYAPVAASTWGFFPGRLDDVRVYSRALSPQEIASLYRSEAPALPFADGLVAYYPFRGDANDESGNGRSGVVNGATLSKDRFGQSDSAYAFAGKPAHIQLGGISSADFEGDFTVSAWINVELPSLVGFSTILGSPSMGWGVCILGRGYQPPDVRYGWLNVSGAAAVNKPWANMYETDLNAVLSRGWFQVVLVRAGAGFKTFVNGKAVAVDGNKITGNPDYLSDQLAFSGMGLGGPGPLGESWQYFVGQLDDIRLYRRALSDQEVRDLYRYEAPVPPRVTIDVKTVAVTLYVTPNHRYQLESSFDLGTWTNLNAVFLATSAELVQEFNAAEVGRFYRLREVP